MAMKAGAKAQERIEAEIRKLSRLEGNRTCVDCPEKMPGYVNMTQRTFVCTKCSGIHRELQMKVKGISMSVFTAEDVADMAAGGNIAHNEMYMARYQASDYALPSGNDVGKLREFMKRKYVEKKWHYDRNCPSVSAPTSYSFSGSSSFGENNPFAAVKVVSAKSNFLTKIATTSRKQSFSTESGSGTDYKGPDLLNLSPPIFVSSPIIADEGFDPFGFEAPSVGYSSEKKGINIAIGEKRKDRSNSFKSAEKMPPPPIDFSLSSNNLTAEFDMFSSPRDSIMDFSTPSKPALVAPQPFEPFESPNNRPQGGFNAFETMPSPEKVPTASFSPYSGPASVPGYPQGNLPPTYSLPPTSGNPFDVAGGAGDASGGPYRMMPSPPGPQCPMGPGPQGPMGPYIHGMGPQGMHYPHSMPYYPPQGPPLRAMIGRNQGPGSMGQIQGPGTMPHHYYNPGQSYIPGQPHPGQPHPGQWAPPHPYPQAPGPASPPQQTLPDAFTGVSTLGWSKAGAATTPSSVTYVPQSPGMFQDNQSDQRQFHRSPPQQSAAPAPVLPPVIESLNPFDMY